jgi:hypothetical protein
LTPALELTTVLNTSPDHSIINLKSATVVNLKHAATAINLKPTVVDLATIVLPSISPVCPLPIVNALPRLVNEI